MSLPVFSYILSSMIILLCGPMGAGKSALLHRIARSDSAYCFEDLDQVILARAGYETVEQLVEAKGWDFFRQKEYQHLESLLLEKKNLVLALGGGSLNERALELIEQTRGYLIYLQTPFEVCYQRICNQAGRPLLREGREFLYQLFLQREAWYLRSHIYLDMKKQQGVKTLKDLLKLCGKLD